MIRLTIARYHTPSGRCIQKPYGEDIDYHKGYYLEETYSFNLQKDFDMKNVVKNFENLNHPFNRTILSNNILTILLKNNNLNPGDKFIVCSSANIYEENLVDLLVKENEQFKFKANPKIALNVVSIEESGKIVYLNSDLLQYELDHTVENETNTYKYHILGKITDNP